MANIQNQPAEVPVYQLYGEDQHWLTPDMVHCESIAARSRLHNWEIKPHRHHGLFQLLWLEKGAAGLQLDDRAGQLDAGRILLVPQHCVHGFRFSPDAQGLVLTLAYPLFERFAGELGRELSAVAGPQVCDLDQGGQHVLVESLMRSLEQEYRGNARHRRQLIESLLAALLALLLRQQDNTLVAATDVPLRAHQHLAQFTEAIESDFACHHPLEHYARKVGISAAHLNTLCRQIAKRSALDLIHARITLEAKRNLVYNAMTIRAISDVLGFSDPAYFTRFFKRQTGLSPKEFRLQAKSLVAEEQNSAE
jgi:AraC family transcriptional activator of pobA